MRYPYFEALGLCTSSGVVEAGRKVAAGTRLKRADMHWTRGSSNAIVALRCSRLSGRLQDFWEPRVDARMRDPTLSDLLVVRPERHRLVYSGTGSARAQRDRAFPSIVQASSSPMARQMDTSVMSM